MSAPVTASERGLRALAGIVSDDRDDLPAEGLPPSLLADLMDQMRCDGVSLQEFDSGREEGLFARHVQGIPAADDVTLEAFEALDPVHWQHYWECQPCCYPERTTWRTSTKGCTSPAAPPPSHAPSPTGSHRASSAMIVACPGLPTPFLADASRPWGRRC
jgi:hypothetical protein